MLSKLAVVSLAFAASGMVCSAALAQESGVTRCVHMGRQVSQALDSNAQSPNYSDARDLKRAGSEFCQAGFYDQGLQRYSKALELLGVDISKSQGQTQTQTRS